MLNKFQFILKYLSKHFKSALVILVVFVVFISINVLYDVNIWAVIYPSLIALFFVFVFLIFDVNGEYHKYKQLFFISHNLLDIEIDYPQSQDINYQIYQDMIEQLMNENKNINNKYISDYSNMVEYYTLWAHQIKTPIASMKLQLQQDDSQQARILLTKLNQIENYVALALAYFKLDNSSNDFVFKKYDLDTIIKNVIKEYSIDFINKKLTLNFNETKQIILTDEKWLTFIISQILDNSLKYTQKGKVEIYYQDDTLFVKDSGIGINSADLPRVFEKGFSGFNGRVNRKSSGIGLYVVKKIANKLNIDVFIESEVNQGCLVGLKFKTKEFTLE